MKIYEAAIKVLNLLKQPANVQEIYDVIIQENLYVFGAKKPTEVLRVTVMVNSNRTLA